MQAGDRFDLSSYAFECEQHRGVGLAARRGLNVSLLHSNIAGQHGQMVCDPVICLQCKIAVVAETEIGLQPN